MKLYLELGSDGTNDDAELAAAKAKAQAVADLLGVVVQLDNGGYGSYYLYPKEPAA